MACLLLCVEEGMCLFVWLRVHMCRKITCLFWSYHFVSLCVCFCVSPPCAPPSTSSLYISLKPNIYTWATSPLFYASLPVRVTDSATSLKATDFFVCLWILFSCVFSYLTEFGSLKSRKSGLTKCMPWEKHISHQRPVFNSLVSICPSAVIVQIKKL